MATRKTVTPSTLAGVVQAQSPTPIPANGRLPDTPLPVTLEPTAIEPTADQALWTAIRNRSSAIGFDAYQAFIDRLLCEGGAVGAAVCGARVAEPAEGLAAARPVGAIGAPSIDQRRDDLRLRPSIAGRDAYELLKLATEAFLLFEGGVAIEPPRSEQPPPAADEPIPGERSRLGRETTWEQARADLQGYLREVFSNSSDRVLPYLARVVEALLPADQRWQGSPFCDGLLNRHTSCPLLAELWWSWCHERGYLVQSMNAVALRYQNHRRGAHDPLAAFTLDPLRPLANLMWGYVQDRQRIPVAQRVLGYEYCYGLTLPGRAAAAAQPVERRSGFMDRLSQLLQCVQEFYVEDADTTRRPDGFRLLQALKELHLELAQSANNHTWELTRAMRVEMLVMQYLMGRQEMASFLRGRSMVPFREKWMPQVDTMKRLQGWPDIATETWRALAESGERVFLSVRLHAWIEVDDTQAAMNWARYWRPEIQSLLHAARSAGGIDLAARRVELQAPRAAALQVDNPWQPALR